MDEAETETSVGASMVALVVCVIVYTVVDVIAVMALNLLDLLRGVGDFKGRGFFGEVFVALVASNLVMEWVCSRFKKARMGIVFYGFVVAQFILMGVYIGIVGPVADKIGVDFWDYLMVGIPQISAVTGAYLFVKRRSVF